VVFLVQRMLSFPPPSPLFVKPPVMPLVMPYLLLPSLPWSAPSPILRLAGLLHVLVSEVLLVCVLWYHDIDPCTVRYSYLTTSL